MCTVCGKVEKLKNFIFYFCIFIKKICIKIKIERKSTKFIHKVEIFFMLLHNVVENV